MPATSFPHSVASQLKSCVIGPHRLDAPTPRARHLRHLHCTQAIPALSRTVDGDAGHSILQPDLPDREEEDCAPSKMHQQKWSPAAWTSCLSRINMMASRIGYGEGGPMEVEDREDQGGKPLNRRLE